MDPEFWRARWREGRIGFHQPAPNELLVRHAAAASAGVAPRVLVPLCGKSLDLAWLAERGQTVVGVELVEAAVRAFFDEQRLAPSRTDVGDGVRYDAGAVSIHAGDFFAVGREHVGELGWAYDRAALVALPPEMRPRYAAHLLDLLPVGGRVLLVTFVYDTSKVEGPPFSVPDDEVARLFGADASVALLERRDVAAESPRLRAAGAGVVEEAAWLVTKR